MDPAPDVLVVVMDCVRALDFPGARSDAASMPFVDRLRRESVTFPRAASVAPWTLPSHASLFTGRYPWEHGCHGRGSMTLNPSFPRLAERLRDAGYRSLSLSANPIISPLYRLVDGFDVAEWGEWWEQVYRVRPRPSHRHIAAENGNRPEVPELSSKDRTLRMVKTMLTRWPFLVAVEQTVLRRTVDPSGRWVGCMNPWIEPELRQWLGQQPAGQPTFCFINLLDAHEPYFLDMTEAQSFRDWWRYVRFPQDVLALLAGPTPPDPNDLARLHELYRRSLSTLDQRIERIVETYREAGRWANTLMVLTSDHGQAFGEHGMIFHGARTDEEMLRVPLLLRLPGGAQGGAIGRGWASPMDVYPTVLEATGRSLEPSSPAISLTSLIDHDRPAPLLCAGDGTEWNRPFMAALTPERRIRLNQFSIAAYTGSTKLVVDAASPARAGYDLTTEPPTSLPESRLSDPDLASVLEDARRAAAILLNPAAPPPSDEVDERLRSWGYG